MSKKKTKPFAKLQESEIVALNTFLSGYDNTLTFDEILQQITDEDESENAPLIWQVFENYDKNDLVSWIENLDEECSDLNEPVRVAAPELLSALQICREQLNTHIKLIGIGPDWEAIEAADAAIAKATTN